MLYLSLAWAAETSPTCSSWATDGTVTTLESADIPESSGVAEGRLDSDIFYTLDDQGNKPVLHLFKLDGSSLGDQDIRGAEQVDWEDLAAGPCPAGVSGDSCLYIGDIGDNDQTRKDVVVYVVGESVLATADATACHLTYPEGKAHNAEALLVSGDGTLRIVTKNSDGKAKVFRLDELDCSKSEELTEEAEISLDGATEDDRKVTGGAVSDDGTLLVLRSYSTAWIWRGCTVDWNALPEVLALSAQPKGEAITIGPEGDLITTSEGLPFRIWDLPCEDSEDLKCGTCGCDGQGSWLALGVIGVGLGRRRAKSRL